jgi:hypothetical protein
MTVVIIFLTDDRLPATALVSQSRVCHLFCELRHFRLPFVLLAAHFLRRDHRAAK